MAGKRSVPWGISESGYNVVDANLNYQYRAFGVPGLGFKRGLGEELVIAPYATMMALMVNPEAAIKNLKEIANDGYRANMVFMKRLITQLPACHAGRAPSPCVLSWRITRE